MRDRWKYLFEGGSKEDVLTALAVYQNDDGGFGHALEPDCWNPDSSPIQTWVATEIIHEIGLEDKGPPVVQGILRYLSSGKDFDGHTWANTIASNNAAPHASWWEHTPAAEPSYNPTACLIAFILKFADRESRLFALACDLAKEAYSYFKPFKDNRAFYKYICPITVFLKPMSYFSMLRIKCDASKCIFCGKCKRVCPMNVDVTDNSRKREHGTECILCLECVRHCPRGLCRRTGRLWRRRCRTTDP